MKPFAEVYMMTPDRAAAISSLGRGCVGCSLENSVMAMTSGSKIAFSVSALSTIRRSAFEKLYGHYRQ